MATAKTKSFADMISGSAREIWLTGLGAVSAMEEEGTKLYHNFVEKGKGLSKDLEKKGEDLEKKFKDKIGSYSKKEDISKFFEEKMNQAFETVGLSRNSEVKELNYKIDKLNEDVAVLSEKLVEKTKKPGPAPSPTM